MTLWSGINRTSYLSDTFNSDFFCSHYRDKFRSYYKCLHNLPQCPTLSFFFFPPQSPVFPAFLPLLSSINAEMFEQFIKVFLNNQLVKHRELNRCWLQFVLTSCFVNCDELGNTSCAIHRSISEDGDLHQRDGMDRRNMICCCVKERRLNSNLFCATSSGEGGP